MASTRTKIEVGVVVLIIAAGIGYFIYSNATSNVAEVDISLGEGSNWFTPTNATVKLGQPVTIVVFNDDDNAHTFAIQAFNASTGVIASGLSGRNSFVSPTRSVTSHSIPP